ncbi:TauD/TfdA family dioxygenase [Nocardia sp. NPDC056952]|uniref:TauD/TfdA family dioxygenase n=1 Tax=Nocardia sp. NPDC056952 TaxID=3345979 RepID=UPI00363EC132
MNLPALIEAPHRRTDLTVWLTANKHLVDELLAGPGAILLRGFDVGTTAQFRSAVAVVLGPLMEYVEGASPRALVGPNVYTSTEYSPELLVALHNELSYSHRWPARLAFYCQTPAPEGGQTPLADCRKVYSRIVDVLPEAFSTVEYRRHLRSTKGLAPTWQTVFATEDNLAVEQYCRNADIAFEWTRKGGLRTRQIRPAAVLHPTLGEPVWFNQAHQWHPSNAGVDAEQMLREAYGDQLPMDAFRGDGSRFAATELETIRTAYQAEESIFDWIRGDILLLDNMLTAHGRRAFSGPREVYVAMGGPISINTVEKAKINA